MCLSIGYLKNIYGRSAVLSDLWEYETRSVKLREERASRVSQNRALTRIFSHRVEEVTGECSKLRSEALSTMFTSHHTLFECSDQGGWDEVEIREEHTARRCKKRNMYRILVVGGNLMLKKENLEEIRCRR